MGLAKASKRVERARMKGWRRRDDEDDEDGGVEVEALDDEAFPLPQPPVYE